ncbi:hypothetical protein HMPREF3226_00677 [Prevotella corporis]|uniref:Uncharacterized protein n=1 Tax=Prevotella corporis TaxID=28128 RepID=A0A133QHP5_9BACT|nr:hypothetical protein HMPREF3226_00677 [Prevotella corporis]
MQTTTGTTIAVFQETVLFLSTSIISCRTFDCRPPKKQGLTVESLLCI